MSSVKLNPYLEEMFDQAKGLYLAGYINDPLAARRVAEQRWDKFYNLVLSSPAHVNFLNKAYELKYLFNIEYLVPTDNRNIVNRSIFSSTRWEGVGANSLEAFRLVADPRERTMFIADDMINFANSAIPARSREDAATALFILAHEVGHGFGQEYTSPEQVQALNDMLDFISRAPATATSINVQDHIVRYVHTQLRAEALSNVYAYNLWIESQIRAGLPIDDNARKTMGHYLSYLLEKDPVTGHYSGKLITGVTKDGANRIIIDDANLDVLALHNKGTLDARGVLTNHLVYYAVAGLGYAASHVSNAVIEFDGTALGLNKPGSHDALLAINTMGRQFYPGTYILRDISTNKNLQVVSQTMGHLVNTTVVPIGEPGEPIEIPDVAAMTLRNFDGERSYDVTFLTFVRGADKKLLITVTTDGLQMTLTAEDFERSFGVSAERAFAKATGQLPPDDEVIPPAVIVDEGGVLTLHIAKRKLEMPTGVRLGKGASVDYLNRRVKYIYRGDRIIAYTVTNGHMTVVTTLDESLKPVATDIKLHNNPLIIEFSDAGAILGQQLGLLIAGEDKVTGIVTSAAMKTLGNNLGDAIEGLIGQESVTHAVRDGFKSFGQEFLGNLKAAGVGAVSSYLTAELISMLGIDGVVGEFANATSGAVIGQIATNLANLAAGAQEASDGSKLTAFSGIDATMVVSAAASYIGTKLANEIYSFDTVGGQIGSAVGSAVGAYYSGLILASASTLNPVVIAAAVAVVVVANLVGGLIGSEFGGTPRASADVEWDASKGAFVAVNPHARIGGSKDAAMGLASAVAETFNGLVAASGGTLLNPAAVQAGSYGMRKSDYVYRRPVGDKSIIDRSFSGKDGASKLIGYGVYRGIADPNFQIVGGNVYVKRAIYNSYSASGTDAQNLDTGILLGNIASAKAYENYLLNADIMKALISAEPNSIFALEAAITLNRAVELGLTRRHKSDWYGGFSSLLTEANEYVSNVAFGFGHDPYSNKISRRIGVGTDVLTDTIDIAAQTEIEGGSGHDLIDIRGARLADQRDYTVNGRFNNDIAVSSSDFSAPLDASLSFAPAELRTQFTVALVVDGQTESVESFLGRLGNAPDMEIIDGEATALIIDAAHAAPTLMVGDSYAHEADGHAIFRLSLSKASTEHVTVALTLADDGASGAAVDYGAIGNSNLQVSSDGINWADASEVTFFAGVTELFVRVAITWDNLRNPRYRAPVINPLTGTVVPGNGEPEFIETEGNEGFKLSARVTSGASALANGADTVSGTGTIVDGVGERPLVWIDNVVVHEATGQAVFTVSRSRTTSAVTTVDFSTADRRILDIEVAATVDSGGGNDEVHASDLGDNIFGGAGNDKLYGGRLDDWLLGGEGDDVLNAGSAGARTLGGDGNYLSGGLGNDVLIGREGSDWLDGGGGADTLEGGNGDDVLVGGAGHGDVLRGGRGNDQYLFQKGDVGSDELDHADVIHDESGLSLETIVARVYEEMDIPQVTTLLGNGELFRTGRGLDNWAGGGVQVTSGGVAAGGEDVLVLGRGITLDDIKIRKANEGQDLVVELWPEDTLSDSVVLKDWFSSFNKIETLRFDDGNEVRLADLDTFILGTGGSDTIIGTDGDDFVHAGSGNDVVLMLGGNDFGTGGLGNDSVSGDSGDDAVVGADGDDALFGGDGKDFVGGGRGNDTLYGDGGDDVLSGGAGDDELIGGEGDDVFKFKRGDGSDTFIDALGGEWEAAWRSVDGRDSWVNNYSLSQLHDGQQWIGRTRYDVATATLLHYKGDGSNLVVTDEDDNGDAIEFDIDIDINDLQFGRANSDKDIVIGIEPSDGVTPSFSSLSDRIILKEWGPTGQAGAYGSIESFVFFNVGAIDVSRTRLDGGTDANDVLGGLGATRNWITGGGGDDQITGGALGDILNGNSGDDRLLGLGGADVLLGGAGSDVLIGGAGDGTIAGDTLVGGDGLDMASYETATAAVRASLSDPREATDATAGDAAGDSYSGIEGLRGSTHADRLEGNASDNYLEGGAGEDTLLGGKGHDTYIFRQGDGRDVVNDLFDSSKDIVINNTGKLMRPYVARLELVRKEKDPARAGEFLYHYEHIVENGDSGEIIYRKELPPAPERDLAIPTTYDPAGWAQDAKGNSIVTINDKEVALLQSPGFGGDDILLFEDPVGADGTVGDQSIGLSDLRFKFGSGTSSDDLIISLAANPGDEVHITGFRTGSGVNADRAIETIQFADGSSIRLAGLRFNASGALLSASGDTLAAPVDDLIIGKDDDDAADTLTGGFGDDVLSGLGGDDTLEGGEGKDLLSGGKGADVLRGGAGSDTVTYLGADDVPGIRVNLSTGEISASGSTDADTDLGEARGDTIDSIENVVGTHFNDALTGDANDNILKGNRGDDELTGGLGADVLIGDDGADKLSGGGNDDNIDGGAGNDELDGGGDRDLLAGGDGNDILRGDGISGNEAGGNLVADLGSVRLDAGVENIEVSRTITGFGAGENLKLSFSSVGESSDTSSAYEVLWNGEVIAVVPNGARTAKVIDLVAKEGSNVLTFRGLGATDGDGAIIDNVVLARMQGAADQLIGGAGIDRLEGGAGKDILIGGDGNDAESEVVSGSRRGGLYGGTGDDVLDGGAGDDSLYGGSGADTYMFHAGSGNDQVVTGGGADELVFDDISSSNLWFSQPAGTQDLLITAIGGGASVLVEGWFSSSGNQARRIVAGDKMLSRFDVEKLRLAMLAESSDVPGTVPAAPSDNLIDAMEAAWQTGADYVDRAEVIGTLGHDNLAPESYWIGPVLYKAKAGDDVVLAGAGDDIIVGGSGSDTLLGGLGNDEFQAGSEDGLDSIDGGGGIDTISATEHSARINLQSLANVERITGGSFSDVRIALASGLTLDLSAVAVENVFQINGDDGDETIIGSVGGDRIFGFSGDDTLSGGLGDDWIQGGEGNDNHDGGDGIDTLDQSFAMFAQTINLRSNQFSIGDVTETAINFENAVGGSAGDEIVGTIGANRLDGNGGSDSLDAGDGADVLIGGAGADILLGGLGSDTASYATQVSASAATAAIAGVAIDGVIIDLVANSSVDGLTLPAIADRAKQGDAEGDWFHQIENLEGSAFNDSLTGDDGNNLLSGGAGDDFLYGREGHDTAVYSGNRAHYEISADGSGGYTVRDNNAADGDDGLDRLHDIQDVRFADMTTSLGTSANDPPQLGAPALADQVWYDGEDTSYQIPSTAFFDPDQDALTFTATLADGSALPAWLTFDPASGVFRGSPPHHVAGTVLSLKVTAADQQFSVSDIFLLTIEEAEGMDIVGSERGDFLTGTFRRETMIGLGGDDTLAGSPGADRLDGGAGRDDVHYLGSGEAVSVDLSLGLGSGGDAEGDRYIAVENVTGSAFADTIIGSNDANSLLGDAGDDMLDGGAGDDLLNGQDGYDILRGGAGGDTIYAGTLGDGSVEDLVDGGIGSDTLNLAQSLNRAIVNLGVGSGNPSSIEHVKGTAFADTINGNEQNNSLSGGFGDDVVFGAGGNDTLSGGLGNDNLDGGDGDDWIYGEVGDDRLRGGSGSNILYGGAGTDTADYRTAGSGLNVIVASGAWTVDRTISDNFADGMIENVDASDHADVLTGSAGANVLKGFAGDDKIHGGDGNDGLDGGDGADKIHGGLGADTLAGGSGNDELSGETGADTIDGGAGDDVIHLTADGEDIVDGGAGTDTANFAAVTDALAVDLADPAADKLTNVENVTGGVNHDVLSGSAAANVLDGGGGSDTLTGHDGGDSLYGGSGNDILDGGAGVDTLYGGDGDDVIHLLTVGEDLVDGGAGVDRAEFRGTNANLIIDLDNATHKLTGIEQVVAGGGNDDLKGSSGANLLEGGVGNDVLSGGAGDDILRGDAGGDILHGDSGNDTLEGGDGDDQLSGGVGADTLRGGAGYDTLLGSADADNYDGGIGTDTVDFRGSSAGVRINLSSAPVNQVAVGSGAGGDAEGDIYTSIENVTGSELGDEITGTSAQNVLVGRAGADLLTGGGGNDGLYGNSGADTLRGDAGNDTLVGGSENDDLTGGSENDLLYGEGGNDVLDGGSGVDTLSGGDGNDTIRLSTMDEDLVDGGAGVDRVVFSDTNANLAIDLEDTTDKLTSIEQVVAGGGNDNLKGSSGANLLDGGIGDDLLEGRGGADALDGGLGIDTVTYVSSTGSVDADLSTRTGANADAAGDTFTDIENLTGSSYADRLAGNDGVNDLKGEGGGDFIYGGAGDDTIAGGDGDDTLYGDAGADTVRGGAGNDMLFGGTGNDRLFGGDGNDILSDAGGDGQDSFNGEAGDDVLLGSVGADTYDGGLGVDTVDFTASSVAVRVNLSSAEVKLLAANRGAGGDAEGDTYAVGTIENVTGGAGDDLLMGSADANILVGGAGHDELTGGAGNDELRGDAGSDILQGDAGNDTLQGGIDNDELRGGAENDTLSGDDGDDKLYGDDGIDTLNGGAGNDELTGGAGADTVFGGAGNDTINLMLSGEDLVDGGAGIDTASYAGRAKAVTVDLANSAASKLTNVENVTGGSGGDTLSGSALANKLDGGEGDDILEGRGGADILIGGDGSNDWLSYKLSTAGAAFRSGLVGASTVNGVVVKAAVDLELRGVNVDLEAGTAANADASGDTFFGIEHIAGSAFGDQLKGTSGDNLLYGMAGDDVIYGGAGRDLLSGDQGNDILYGDGGVDHLYGGDGNDRLIGGADSDYLWGEAGDDILDAGDMGDQLDGGMGNDTLIGGAGADAYVATRWSGHDTIYNYDTDNDPEKLDAVLYDHLSEVKNTDLWFSKVSGTRDLLVKVLGADSSVKIKDWFSNSAAGDYSHENDFAVDIFIAGEQRAGKIDVPKLLTLMAAQTEPLSFSALSSATQADINKVWANQKPPKLTLVGDPRTIDEDGTIELLFTVDDGGETPNVSITIAAEADGPLQIVGTEPVNETTRKVRVRALSDASGVGTVTVTAFDGFFRSDEVKVPLTVEAIPDQPILGLKPFNVNAGTVVDIVGTLAGGVIARLSDTGEVFNSIIIRNIPAGAILRSGTNSFPATSTLNFVDITTWDLSKLQLQLPAGSSAEFSLMVEATSREPSNGKISTVASEPIKFTVNGTPIDVAFSYSSPQINENAPNPLGMLIGTLTAVDPGDALADSSYIYTVTGDETARFMTKDNQLWLKPNVSLDHEAPATVKIQITDTSTGTPLTPPLPFEVRIQPNNINEAPTGLADTDGAANQINENAAPDTAVGIKMSATDPEGGSVTYSLQSPTQNWFAINPTTGVITVRPGAVVDYERANSVSFNVLATDNTGLETALGNISVTIGNLNEKPVITSSDSTTMKEDILPGMEVATIISSDPDGTGLVNGTGGHVYSIVGGSTLFEVVGNKIKTKAGTSFDYESGQRSYALQLQVRDNNNTGLSSTQNFTINLQNVNEAPTALADVDTGANQLTEGAAAGTIVGVTMQAADPEGGVTYSIPSVSKDWFVINGATGVVTVKAGAVIDYEATTNGTVSINVEATDGVNAAVSLTNLVLNLVDVNEKPAFTSPDNASMLETAGGGAFVAALSSSDPDRDDLPNGEAGRVFSIVGGTGLPLFEITSGNRLTTKAGTTFNYDRGITSYTLILRVTDNYGTGLSSDQPFTVNLVDVNEAPSGLTDVNTAANAVADEAGAGASTGITLWATDPEGGLTYSITNDPFNWFTVNATTGVVTVRNGAKVNYEATTNGTVSINVEASDGVTTPATSSFVISVVDANDAPTFEMPLSVALSENAAGGSPVVTIKSGDQDKSSSLGVDSHQYTITGGTGASLFEIVGKDIKTRSGAIFDYESTTKSYMLNLNVTDNFGKGMSATHTLTVNIANVNEAPSRPEVTSLTWDVVENQQHAVRLSGSIDPDGTNVDYDFVAGGNPGGLFEILQDGEDGILRLIGGTADFEKIKLSPYYTPESDHRGYMDVRVLGKDSSSLRLTSSERTLRFYFHNVNDSTPSVPTVGQLYQTTFAENSPASSPAKAIAGLNPLTDADGNLNPLSYTLTANPGQLFEVVNNAVYLKANAILDYETLRLLGQPTADDMQVRLTIGIASSDGKNVSTPYNLTVLVNNVNEQPTFGTLAPVTVNENLLVGFKVAAGLATDIDAGVYGNLTYRIDGGNTNGGNVESFYIDNNGDIRIANLIDYEKLVTNKYYDLRFVAIDGGGMVSAPATIRINIGNVADRDTIYSGSGTLPMRGQTSTGFVAGYAYSADSYAKVGMPEVTVSWKKIWKDANGNGIFGDTGPNGDVTLAEYYKDNNGISDTFATGYRWAGTPWASEFYKELPPIVLDLRGSGTFASSLSVQFDVDGDGAKDKVAWISGGQGFLVLDRNMNGIIDGGFEISFAHDLPGAATDLEGLRAYDSNGDGLFDGFDARFAEFQIWQDTDEDGATDAGELRSLADTGIVSIDLSSVKPDSPSPDTASQSILGLSTFRWADGRTGAVGDIALRWDFATTPPPAGASIAIDSDGNGIIDPATEVAGAALPLARFDSNGDGLITPLDAAYYDLRLWTDANVNNRAEPDEIAGLDHVGLTAIDAATPAFNSASSNEGSTGEALSQPGPSHVVEAPDLPVIGFADRSYGSKPGKYDLVADGGSLFVSLRKARGTIDPRADLVGAAALLSFRRQQFGMLAPIILDLDGDGIEMRAIKAAKARFDMNGDGAADDTGWAGRGDGFLVIDRNGDGRITVGSELSFLTDKAGGKSGIDALSALDSNRDGKIDSSDTRFSELKVWVDADGDGATDSGELRTLADHGIASIGLAAQANSDTGKIGENMLISTAIFTRADGSTGTVGGAALAFRPGVARSGGPAGRVRRDHLFDRATALSEAGAHYPLPVAGSGPIDIAFAREIEAFDHVAARSAEQSGGGLLQSERRQVLARSDALDEGEYSAGAALILDQRLALLVQEMSAFGGRPGEGEISRAESFGPPRFDFVAG